MRHAVKSTCTQVDLLCFGGNGIAFEAGHVFKVLSVSFNTERVCHMAF